MGPSAGGSRVADYSILVPPLGRRGSAVGPSAGGGVVDYITMVPPEQRRTGGNRQEPSGNGDRRATQGNRKGETPVDYAITCCTEKDCLERVLRCHV